MDYRFVIDFELKQLLARINCDIQLFLSPYPKGGFLRDVRGVPSGASVFVGRLIVFDMQF